MSDDTGTASNSTVLSLSHRFELLQTREPRKDLAFVRVEPSFATASVMPTSYSLPRWTTSRRRCSG